MDVTHSIIPKTTSIKLYIISTLYSQYATVEQYPSLHIRLLYILPQSKEMAATSTPYHAFTKQFRGCWNYVNNRVGG